MHSIVQPMTLLVQKWAILISNSAREKKGKVANAFKKFSFLFFPSSTLLIFSTPPHCPINQRDTLHYLSI
jgi:hypothetical protein